MAFGDNLRAKFAEIAEQAAPLIATAQEKAATVVATVQQTAAGIDQAAEFVAEQQGITKKEAKKLIVKDLASQAKDAIKAKFGR
jgi:hypothetical protein